ncbi:MAG: hypothetical protein RI945_8 [Candidatus Parcubacteria bacterium]
MKNFFKNQIAVAILGGSLLIALGIVAYGLINNDSSSKNSVVDSLVNADKIFQGQDFKESEYILGNTKNKVTLVVYSDFECPFCKMLQEGVVQELQKKYSLDEKDLSSAKIGIVYRHFAQSYHDKAPTEINASLCARELYGQSTYVNFINRIYSVSPTNNGLDLATLPNIAEYAVKESKEKGQSIKKDFSKEEFVSCVAKNTYNQEYINNSQDAIVAGLEGTPYSLIVYRDGNENMIISKISGIKDESYFEQVFDKLLTIK